MIVVTDKETVDSSTATSEASGYELANAIDHDKPWLKWRSTSLSAQIITLYFSGSINSVTLLGANFEDVTLRVGSAGGWMEGGWMTGPWMEAGGGSSSDQAEVLGYLRALGTYRGLFTFEDKIGSLTIEIPNQAVDESYYELSAIVIGNTNGLTHGANGDIDKRLALPVNEIKLGSEIPKKGALGDNYHIIKVNRRGNNIADLDEFRDIKRVVGKTNSFVFFEDLGKKEDVFLVKRVEPFSYTKPGYLDYHDSMTMEEIAG